MSKPSSNSQLLKLALGALGVVYGDIGTSPLYALKESLHTGHGLALVPENIFGILSLVFWSLVLVIFVKYLTFILTADNRGEGGITALLALLYPKISEKNEPKLRAVMVFLGLFGAGLLYGDGVITPAISVLSAIEGLEVATPTFQPFIVPITVAILVVLFYFQNKGTSKIGSIFGPATLLWFVTLAATGLPWIINRPDILKSLNPYWAIHFFFENGLAGFFVLSSVVLCITGGEALYADMGHFGKKPIRMSWTFVVFPALIINYLGQGALVLEKGDAVLNNTFYGLVSGWMLYPLVAIATLATVIASQALISGAFSLTQQSVQLGFLPRTTIKHTSRDTEGQIFVPKVNWLLMFSCIALVLIFKKSSKLADAYGIAVTGTMVITSILFYLVTIKIWNWNRLHSLGILFLFLIFDLSFFSANLVKILHGGWIPICIALIILVIMSTWKSGRNVLAKAMADVAVPLGTFFAELEKIHPHRTKGAAVFMTLSKDIAPSVLLHHFKHNQTLHEKVILLSIITEHQPEVSSDERIRMTDLEHGFVKIVAKYGYMETPDVSFILNFCKSSGLKIELENLSYFLGRETFVTSGKSKLALWRKKLFILLSRNARPATEFFNLPPDRVIEIGSQIPL